MKIPPHEDPRLTAYALGELDADERSAIEVLLAESPESRQFVEDIRATAQLLTDQLHKEPSPGLASEHRQAIEGRLRPAKPAKRPFNVVYALAAVALVGICLGLLLPPIQTARRAARRTDALLEAATEATPPGRPVAVRNDPPLADFRYSTNAQASATADSSPPSRLSLQDEHKGTMGGMMGMGGGMGGPGTSPTSITRNERVNRRSLMREQMEQPQRAGARPPITVGRYGDGVAFRADAPAVSSPAEGKPDVASLASSASGANSSTRAKRGYALSKGPLQPGQVNPQVSRALTEENQAGQRGQGNGQQGQSQQGQKPGQQAAQGQHGQKPGEQGQHGQSVVGLDYEGRDKAREAEKAPVPLGLDADPQPLFKQEAPIAEELAEQRDAEAFDRIVDNPFLQVPSARLSTFSIDVDTAGYSNVRRFLNQNTLPPKDAVRIEELLNYFPYNDPPPTGDDPFSIHIEVAGCPWNPEHRLARIGLMGRPIPDDERAASNLVFLIDVSGSMLPPNRLPLVQAGLRMLVEQLGENDRVAIVVYAGASGLVLPSTSCLRKPEILSAIEQLQAGGSTNGGAGIQLAYKTAVETFIQKGINRVILATDGDFNVGISDDNELVRLIEAKAKSGVFLSVLGFGMGNLKDSKLEKLADKGNGNYAYIDSLQEARKVLVEQMGSTLVTIAKDVKIQVEFNPAKVGAYRLIGYENRLMRDEDFHDDTKDAGEIGAGHHVTALYELVPAGKEEGVAGVGPLKFQGPAVPAAASDESLSVKLRYKQPDGNTSRLLERGVVDDGRAFGRASDDLKFASAVAGFGMLLRDSSYKGSLTFPGVVELAEASIGPDPSGYRKEFLGLVRKAQALTGR